MRDAAADSDRRRCCRIMSTFCSCGSKARATRSITAGDGEEALDEDPRAVPDLVLLDIMMPKIDGIGTVKRAEGRPSLPFIPVILVTAQGRREGRDRRARSRRRRLPDKAGRSCRPCSRGCGRCCGSRRCTTRFRRRRPAWSSRQPSWLPGIATLETRVAAQLGEIERIRRLKRFLAPQIAEADRGARRRRHSRKPSPRHRRRVLRSARVHRLFRDRRTRGRGGAAARISRRAGSADHRIARAPSTIFRATASWCSSMIRCPARTRPSGPPRWRSRCARRSAGLQTAWRRRGREIGFGVGIAQGYATLGQIGFADRVDYTRDRDGQQSRGTALRRRRGRPDSRQPPYRDRDRRDNAPRTYRRHRPQGAEPGGRGVQHRRAAGIAAPPARA